VGIVHGAVVMVARSRRLRAFAHDGRIRIGRGDDAIIDRFVSGWRAGVIELALGRVVGRLQGRNPFGTGFDH
jgi:hypothetical protein